MADKTHPADRREVTVQLSLRTLSTIVIAGLSFWALWQVREFLILFFASAVVATALAPIVRRLERRGAPRWLAISSIYLFMVSLLLLVLFVVLPQVLNQVGQLAIRLQSEGSLPGGFKLSSQAHGGWWSVLTDIASGSDLPDLPARIFSFATSFLSGLVTLLTFFILTFYLLLEGRKLVRYLLSFVPDEARRSELGDVFVAVSDRMGYWFRGQSVVAITTFLVTYIGLSILRVPYALSLALLAALAEFIPLFGSWVGAVPAILVAASVSTSLAVVTGVFILVWQSFQGQILVPQIMKKVIGIPSVLVFVSVLILAKLLGLIGVFLATPIAAAATVLGQYYAGQMHSRVRQRFQTGSSSKQESAILQKQKE